MRNTIGPASDFYRLRLTRLDVGDDVDFDWRDDVLWAGAPADESQDSSIWVLQAVTLDERESVTPLARYASRDEAEAALGEANDDLAEMTKAQFESEYVAPLVPDDEDLD